MKNPTISKQRKMLFIMLLPYSVLIVAIIAIGINFSQQPQPEITKTCVSSQLIIGKSNEDSLRQSIIAAVNTESQIWIETTIPEISHWISPNPQFSKTAAITATSAEQISTTLTPLLSTSTSTYAAYPVPIVVTSTASMTPHPGTIKLTPTSSISPTYAATPSRTSTSQSGWVGDWTVFWEQSDGSFLSGLMTINVDKSNITASVLMGEDYYKFEGILNESLTTVIGSWLGVEETGNFYWRALVNGQFLGNLDRQLGFCGTREEGNIPEYCFTVPSGN